MAREILFKAKTRDCEKKWVEGYVFKSSSNFDNYIIYNADNDESYLVDINTLCQYTGLTDKNGNKIWDNDVVRKTDTNPLGWGRVRDCTVSFDKQGYWLLTTTYGDGYWIGEFESEQLEVIGNIFDNPELLGGAE